jgi:hypothetical protein
VVGFPDIQVAPLVVMFFVYGGICFTDFDDLTLRSTHVPWWWFRSSVPRSDNLFVTLGHGDSSYRQDNYHRSQHCDFLHTKPPVDPQK